MACTDPTGQIPVRIKGSTKCLHHKQKDVIYFCATCKSLVCSKCGISENHCKQHDLRDISDVAADKTEEVRTFIDKVEKQELPKLKLEIQKIDRKVKENSEIFIETSKKVKAQANKCKEEIDVLTVAFLSLCNKIEFANEKLLRDYQTELQLIHDNLVDETKACKQSLQNGTEVEVFDAADNLPDFEKQTIPELPVMETAELYPQEIVSGLLKQALGLRKTLYKLMEEPFILTKFTFPDQATAIFPTEREQAWIRSGNSVALVDFNGNTVRDLRNSVVMGNMSIAPKTGHVWFAGLEENTINEFSPKSSESAITKFTIKDKPRRLCITRNNRVLVGTEDKLSLYTTSGVVLRTSVNTASAIVIRPWKIVECPVTGNIAVGNEEIVNWDEDILNSHVIVFDEDLTTQFVYRGEDTAGSSGTTFAPGSIVYDYMGNLLIADYSRNTIELISGTGKYIRRIHTAEEYWQGNLGMQPGDVLWTLQISDSNTDEILRIKYYTN
ncbi:uncharacterized protein LOC110443802 [Mizuhopecten yessoensis]|uniref:B box-type domain-containing protein n=1 Tax=Mizuhopecten yessoensis TaxID=6573 RepID=A0A210PE29_MIZYE|nr:uncharacterized protein LOC110443802 [Mizuhopecten yessoensis]OWF34755.1 hypothetical protein KP79_PYT14153 [Mizuhopecten yessoensis]